MNRLILFLIRKRLKLKKYQTFSFNNQTNKKEKFCFGKKKILKCTTLDDRYSSLEMSNLSVNFLLSEEAKERIIKYD